MNVDQPQGDIVDAGNRWIPEAKYREILARVPIVCADVLLSPASDPDLVGLIKRKTYDGGVGWCLVGGAVLRDESLDHAVVRHVRATLGADVSVDATTITLRTVAEYFTTPRDGRLVDPRKHAVALTYTATSTGSPEPLGEALDFAWTPIDALGDVRWGFGQGRVVQEVMEARAADRAAS